MPKYILRCDVRNPECCALSTPDGAKPLSLSRGAIVKIGGDEPLSGRDQDFYDSWRGVLAAADSEEGKRIAVEVQWEASRDAKVAALLKQAGCKNLRELRGSDFGFSSDPSKQRPELKQVLELLASRPPAPPKNLLSRIFKQPQTKE